MEKLNVVFGVIAMNSHDHEKLNNGGQGVLGKSIVASTVCKSKWDLLDLPLEFRNHKDVVITAIKHDCSAFKYASEELQKDPEVVLEAIKLGTPSFMGKANDETVLSQSLEAISKHLHLFDSNDLNFLYVSKWNFPILEREIESMGWFQKIFSEQSKYLRMMKKLYREKIVVFMERIRTDNDYSKKQLLIELDNVRRKKEQESYFTLRSEIDQMPISKRWRQDVKEKSANMCQICESRENIEVHHRDSFYSILKKFKITSREQAFECRALWSTDNGEVLCKKCHDKMESSKKHRAIITEGN